MMMDSVTRWKRWQDKPNIGNNRPTIDFGLVGHYPFDGDAEDRRSIIMEP